MNWLLGLLAAIGFGIGGIGGGGAPASGPALPSQCPGTIADYNVIDKSGKNAIVHGTAGNDFIIAKTGILYGEGGNDCLVITGSGGQIQGGGGDDVLKGGQLQRGDYRIMPFPIYSDVPLNPPCDDEDADETNDCDYGPIGFDPGGFDRCIGNATKFDCELTN